MNQDFASLNHDLFMIEALREAEEAGRRGDRPIGAVIVHDGRVIACGSSRSQTLQSDVAHAENTAIFACAPVDKLIDSDAGGSVLKYGIGDNIN